MVEDRRVEFHSLLEAIPNVTKVYYNPPEGVKLVFPCIVYTRSDIFLGYADNRSYIKKHRYQITLIDSNIDSEAIDVLCDFEHSSYERSFKKDGLNHEIFNIFY